MSHTIRRQGRTSRSALIAAASILELHFFARSAQAQAATGDVSAFQDIASVDGVASVETLDDGRVELTMEDGSVLTVPAGEVQILNGTVFVSESFLIAQGLTASSNNTVLLLTLGAVGVAVAANALESSNDSDDDVVPPVATPPPMSPVFTSSATASVAENQTDAYRAVATDADSDTLSYSLSGTDADRFMIDAATGEVRFIEAPDFEAPGDADADNVYDIIVTASDGVNTAGRTVAIMVTDENEPPIFTSDAAVSVAENQTVAYVAVAADADGDPLNYSLSGTDAARFTIDTTTGEVRFSEAPDFENPGDADGDNVYDIIVTASDGANSAERAVAIRVTDENDRPIFTSDASANVAENQTAAYRAVATDADGNTLSYSLSGTDAARFMIDPVTGEARFSEAPDFEAPGDADGDNVYDIIVTASDGTNSVERAVAIRVTDENDPPIFTSDAAVSVAENQTAAYRAVTTDADGDPLTFSLSGTDASRFTIDTTTGEVRFSEAPDFENPGDADGDNVYNIIVTASDGANSAERAVAIRVTDENDPPVFTSDAVVNVAENQTAAYRAVAADGEGDPLTFSLSGTDASRFTINTTTGEVRFSEAPDFENPGDADGDNVYDIIVTASDGANSAERAVAIRVTDENDPPVFTSDAAVSVAENQTAAYRAVAADADGDPLSYRLSGTDAARFTIDTTTGEVRFSEAPDFENPGDADGDNVYDIIVTASDGANSAERAVAIRVTDENDPPVFTSDAAVNVAENQTAAYRAVAADGEGDPLTFSLSGTDAALFTIDTTTGEVRFSEAPDFENPGDADGDNVYDIIVTASDGTNSTDQTVAITVTDEDDNTAFQRLLDDPEAASVADFEAAGIERVDARTLDAARELLQAIGEDDPPALASLTEQQVQAITDTARDHIVSITGPEDAGIYDSGEFTLGSNPAIVSVESGLFIVALDYDGDGETDHIVNIEFDADYRVQRIERDFGADNSPDDPPDAVEVLERPDDRTVRISYDIRGDGDTDRIETYTLDANGDRIRIDVDTDADGNSDRVESYEVDAGGNRIRTDFDDDADGELDRVEINSYGADDRLIRTDFDDNNDGAVDRTETYTLAAGGNRVRTDFDNNADGNIDRAEFDDDADGATDRSEIYTYDASGNRVRTDFDDNNDGTIDRADFDDNTPIFTSGATVRVAENQTLAYMALATDADGDALSYSLSGTDGALFTINPATGEVSFMAAPDFENPGDAGGDNVYDIVVTVSDGTNSADQTVAVTVTNVDEAGNAPVFTSEATASVAENQSVDSVVYTAMAADADGDVLSYNLSGTDGALFTINPATGEVRFTAAPDFENPGDAGGDNVYDIVVTVSDGTNSADQTVAITVTNVDEAGNAPVFTSEATASVAENQSVDSVVYTAIAADADGDVLSYNLSGTDGALFTINPATGEVRFITAPDFENPGNADGDNVYDIVVTASDGIRSAEQPVAITVTDVNDNPPIFTSEATAAVTENQAAAYTAVATDADGDPLSYSLSGTDAALFTINAATGEVRFITAPDFENPGNADGRNVYDIVVTASDGMRSAEQPVAITVTNVNDNPPIFTSEATAAVAENQAAAYTAVAMDADGDLLSYSLSGTDAVLFTINAATGEVRFTTAPDFENPGNADGDNVYDIVVTASDGMRSAEQPVAITVTNVNDNPPIFTSEATAGVAENQSVDSVVYTAMAADADGDDLSYNLSGTDGALFTINPATGEVRFTAAPDFENPGDAGGDNVYDIVVTASDGTNSAEQPVAITVTNVNDNPPIFTSEATAAVAENQAAAYTAVATDADSDLLSYSLSGTDAALFTINAATGEVRFITAPDFENPGNADGDNVYDIVVTASDGMRSAEQPVAITVTNVNDNPPIFTSEATAGVAENQIAAYTALVTDADGDALSYSLSGTDAALFTIDPATGEVRFITAPDFEAPGNADGDNVYDIVVTVSDGTNSAEQPVAITVTNVNDNPPIFTSGSTTGVAENQRLAYTALVTDADGDALSYSLSGTDAALFTIDPATGVVSFIAAPDFEAPGNADGDNVYDIVVTASDGIRSTEQPVAITVTDVNDNPPIFTSEATATVAENQTAAYTAVATDADGDLLSYSLSGTDAALFTINPATGVVSFIAAPDFEAPGNADGDNVYDIVVTVSDGTNSAEQPVAITVTNVNDNPPIFTSGSTAVVAENQRLAYTALVTDADGDALSYSLSGTDAALFTIDPATGVVSFIAAPDFEAPGNADGDNVYDIVVTVSDAIRSAEQPVAITVTDVNEVGNPPVFTSGSTAGVAENQTAAYTAVATDADGDPLSYSLSGTDAARFTIDPATGEVRFIAAPDVENPGDAGGDNIYDIVVTASDGPNRTNQPVAITVTDVNDNQPIFTSETSAGVAENQTLAYTAMATDADGDALSYSLSGTDAALFTINAATGEVRFREAPDFENPGDMDRDNVYDITVAASDNINDTNQDVAIRVTNVNDNTPSFTSDATVNAAENQTAAYTAVATDGDGDDLTYSLSGTDAALFTIDPATGVVSFIAPPDFENPGDAGRNNVYDIVVTASDGPNDANQPVAITVTNVNDNTPSFTSDTTASVAENRTLAYTAMATDADGDALSYSLSGTDAALFTINAATGEVRFREAPDFENPGDMDRDNVYDITVTASDDINDTNQDVAIRVTNANDNTPSFTSDASVNAAENQTAAYTAVATDGDGDDLTYSLSGTDAALFTIDPATGVVSFIAPPDFENPGDAGRNNVYDIVVTASDGPNDANQPVAITVTNVNDNTPSFTSDATASVTENRTLAYTAMATDADGDALSYSLSGTDAALFTINAATGEVRFREAPDFENPGDMDRDNVYDITVTASDDINDTNQDVAIRVTNVNDNTPSFTSDATVNAAENQTAAYTAVATDRDGDDLTYSLSGTDVALFTIDPATGVVSFITPPDFENPGDAGRNNVYDIVVTASDGPNDANQPVAITVTNVNDNTPSFTSDATASVTENRTLAYTAMATDADGDALTYSLSGTDATLFTINAATGEVRFREAPDFENPGDMGRDNVYDITVTASDDINDTNQDVAIRVTNVNDNTPSFTSDASVNVAENQTAAYTAVAADADGDTLTYSLSGTDAALFTIDPATGAVSFMAAPDFENPGDMDRDNVYDITVTASDDINDTNQDVAIRVTNVNDNTPSFTSDASVNVAENQTAAYTAVAADADGDTLTYSLSGTDAALFTIDPATGVVSFITPPDFENPGDAGRNNVYDIVVTASDGPNDANQPVAITVTNVNDNTPSFTSDATASVTENRTLAYTAMATDADGDALTYSLSGTDATLFTINAATGEVRFREAPDFENPGDMGRDNVYDITVTASDDINDTNQDVAIRVTNVNDNTPSFTSDASVNVAENQTAAYTAVAADADGDTLTYSLSGTDAALFTIDPATGAVSFMAAPDFENPGDMDRDNVYDITVTASDDINDTNQDVAIRVTNVNDNTPSFTSDASVNVAENQTAAYTAVAADADGDTLTYSLSGTDAALFTIDPATGVVSFITPPDFENPGDAGRNNVYDIVVTASDGPNDANQPVAITVTNVNDNTPSFTSDATASVTENRTLAYTAMATDADGDALTYSLSGTDAALFTINAATGEVRFITAPDFENPGDDDDNNVYDIIVTASDNTNETEHAVAITVTNENDNDPIFTSGASVSVAENQSVDSVLYTAQATDEDGDALTYSLSGADAARFTIDPATGEVRFIAPPDFENPGDAGTNNVYDVIVTASDNTNETEHNVAITVTNENDNDPIFNSGNSASVPENQSADSVLYTAQATDEDGDSLTYSLSGTDAARFTIDPTTGAVRFIASPDFENPDDADRNNVYDIIVTASDNTNETEHAVAITVTNENDNDPIFISGASVSVAENQSVDSVLYTAQATDEDGDALTYSLSGADAARFTIDPTTGAVRFIASPDFENPDDADRNNVYDITVTASDGTNETEHNVAITVTNENDNDPIFTSGAAVSVAENQSADSVLYTAQATDEDGDTLTYSLSGTDTSRFTIDPTTGAVRFLASPDFENPDDADRNNVYDITVTASDGTNETEHNVAITVTNENDNDPTFTSGSSVSVAENQSADSVVYTAQATDEDGDSLTYSLSGTDAARFTIDPTTGAVRFIEAPDFENPGDDDDDNVYDITVTASDGTNETEHNVAITVTNENDNDPIFTSGAAVSVAENQSADSVLYTAQATDEDGDSLTTACPGRMRPGSRSTRLRARPAL